MAITIRSSDCTRDELGPADGATQGAFYCVDASDAGLPPGKIPMAVSFMVPGHWPMVLRLDESSVDEGSAVYRNEGPLAYTLTIFND